MIRFIDGYNGRPNDLEPGDAVSLKVVAVVGQSGLDWAAYMGPTTDTDERVALAGSKIAADTANSLFWLMRNLTYRG